MHLLYMYVLHVFRVHLRACVLYMYVSSCVCVHYVCVKCVSVCMYVLSVYACVSCSCLCRRVYVLYVHVYGHLSLHLYVLI